MDFWMIFYPEGHRKFHSYDLFKKSSNGWFCFILDCICISFPPDQKIWFSCSKWSWGHLCLNNCSLKQLKKEYKNKQFPFFQLMLTNTKFVMMPPLAAKVLSYCVMIFISANSFTLTRKNFFQLFSFWKMREIIFCWRKNSQPKYKTKQNNNSKWGFL